MMADLPVLPELRFVEVPAGSRHRYVGDRLSYCEAGDPAGRPVLLLHGIGANSWHWRFQFTGLAERARLIAWNAPGYLLTDNLRSETPTARDYADALADLLMALKVDEFDVVANSFGTRVAQCFAHFHSGRMRRAVFTGTSIRQITAPEEQQRSIADRAEMIGRGGYRFGDRAAALLGSAASQQTIAVVRETLRATNPAGFMQAARFGALAQMPPLGSGLPRKLLLVQGEEDRVTPQATNAALLIAAMPSAEVVRLAGCGHLPEVEMPRRCNELIAEHIGLDQPT